MTHTPGPWTFMPSNQWSDLGGNQPSSVCHIGDFTIVTGEPSYEFHGTDEADARLIAAAPDMLAALSTMVDAWDMSDDEGQHRRIWDEARAAIAKATGAQ